MKHFALVTAVAAAVITCAAPAAAEERWSIATSSTGSGPYIIGSAIAQTVNERENVVALSAQTSGGYNENLMLVVQGKVNSGLTLLADLRNAYLGEGKFATMPDAKKLFAPLRRMFPVTTATFHCAVRADSGIRTFADLKGKKLNINVPSTSTQQINRAMIDALGMKVGDFTIFEIATSKSFDALGDRIVDATCNGLPMPGSPLMQLAASTPVNIISLPDDAFARLNKTYGGTMLRVTIPANTYPGQTADVKTFAYPEVLFVRADANADLVYAITKAYWQGPQPNNPAFKQITLQNAALDVEPPIHPGVVRYLRERGLVK
jgi:TRAP transporter TAXI family solute receptor